MSASAASTPQQERAPTHPDRHEQAVEEREAVEYWGRYLFLPDKTGTDKLKSLLRGLKDVMNTQYNTDHNQGNATIDLQPDLTPDQLAHFYRDLHGNYDQLFLGTPHESLAFIYKSLGCLHSLQPQSFSHSTAFTDPTVPALKTEGWIMWQTIQLLLGPDEHSQFIMEAVQKWDIRDPVTGEQFPKLLPRICFPEEPDSHMVAWYEGVSERLRKEAEDDDRAKEVEVERTDVGRLRHRPVSSAPPADELGPAQLTDDEGSVDSRGPALAYFRNPLYRHVDGRPSIVRRSSKRPALSPRPTTMMDKVKETAATGGHVLRNIASPHLWEGRASSRHSSRDREGMGRRRRSLPDHRHPSGLVHHPGEPPPPTSAGAYDGGNALSPHEQRHRRRRPSQQVESRPSTANSGDDEDDWDADESSQYASPRPTPPHSHPHHRRAPEAHKRDSALRHSRSHDPTPSQKEYGDYFEGYDDPQERRNSTYDPSSAVGTPPPNAGGGFGPSASPLFATHVAKRPQPPPPTAHFPAERGGGGSRMASADPYATAPRHAPSIRRAQQEHHGSSRPYSRSPAPSDFDRRPDNNNNRHHDGPRRTRFEQSPADYDDDFPRGPPPPPLSAAGGGGGGYDARRPPARSFDLAPPSSSSSHSRGAAYTSPPPGGAPGMPRPLPPGSAASGNRRRSGRMSGSDADSSFSPDPSRQGRPKMTRFGPPAEGGGQGLPPPPQGPPGRGGSGRPTSGVDGRRYLDPFGRD
ncbi:hypothetical protein B0A55_08366 [Friedmanniomyces simplex]|uniref:DUF7514 domain-containing protein n=1 Tax=Friedmanniomyces simplex TaxID=329884 RepID=A0A4U0X968_9PEZI|nr:hypothetical protein B0A55_08366 [Friedmanniomyces simplex]